jgi:trigger factor
VSVNDQELTDRIVFQAQQYQVPPEEFVQRLQQAGQLGAVYSDVRRSKALLAAVRAVSVTDGSGAPVDLSDLFGPQEPAEVEPVEEAVEAVEAVEAEPIAEAAAGTMEGADPGDPGAAEKPAS